MRIGAIICVVLLFLITGCSDKNKVPSDILPREKMGEVLWDMVQADQYADIYVAKDTALTSKKIETLKLYDKVLRIHNVSRDQFKRSFQFYKDRPDLTRPMLDSILARGTRLRTESYSRMSAPVTRPTAIKPPAGVVPPVNNHLPISPLNRGAGKPASVRDTAGFRRLLPGARPLLTPGRGYRNPVTTPPTNHSGNK